MPLSFIKSPRVVELALFFVGAALGLCFIQSVAAWGYVVAAAAIFTGLRAVCASTASRRRAARIAGWAARIAIGAFHALLVFLVLTWGSRLAWTTAWWMRALVALLGLAVLATWRRGEGRVRMPIALPLGVWIAACLWGWLREESFARCDDFLRARSQPAVELVATTTPEIASCTAGQVVRIGRYPRTTWESLDSRRYLVTMGAGNLSPTPDLPAGAFDGLICEVQADGSAPVRCVGEPRGKAHGIAEADALGQIFITAWGLPGPDGRRGSAVFRLPRDRPLEILEEHRFQGNLGHVLYQPTRGALLLSTDECDRILVVSASDFHPLPSWSLDACPSEIGYDPRRDEGYWCGGPTGIAATFHGDPFTVRVLARDGLSLGRIGFSWGCDWDPATGKIYTAIPNLGLLAVVDSVTGRIERSHFVGFALRSVAYDAARRRAYITDFLGGDVLAVDVDSGAEIARWFAGRFVREVQLTRDRRALLVTSNLGVLRIRLDPS
ncbi:Hypothetical protein A7982_05176 [Minicystis rosea]|nr:Hypothetical protein A7982_05176 [Minicystis rosea]